MSVYLIGTLDTKGREVAFVRQELTARGVEVRVLDAGCLGEPQAAADISRNEVFAAAGTSLKAAREAGDRGRAVTDAATGAAEIVSRDHQAGLVTGVLGLGGSAGTTIATTAMRRLPLGVPKLMVSTLASGQTRPYVGGKDICLMNSVVDISGINRISRTVLGQAARAMAGMVSLPPTTGGDDDRPLIAASMFGVTTPCVQHAQQLLEAAGFEVLVFHATGNGGEAMEGLIADGLIAGVLDITTTELADELVGGVLSAGPGRLTAAGRLGIPQVISVGATDMVNFGPKATVPPQFSERQFYEHNATVTLMRTTADENRAIGEDLGRKAASAQGPTRILLPLRGVSAIDSPGQPFEDAEARTALFDAIRATAGSVEVEDVDHHINDPQFAEQAVSRLVDMIQSRAK